MLDRVCTHMHTAAADGVSRAVDLYNSATGAWSTAQLSVARCDMAATSVGSVAIFAGGWVVDAYSNVVDLYNSTTGAWSTAQLSVARGDFAATSVGTLAMFAGGFNGSTFVAQCSIFCRRRCLTCNTTGVINTVDVYNSVTETWSTDQLSVSRNYPAATSVGGVAIFAGGERWGGGNLWWCFNYVDLYDSSKQLWTTAQLSSARSNPVATSVGNVAVFAGGSCTNSTF